MATRAQLEAEVWWGAEFVPPNLSALIRRLRSFYAVDAIGAKGDENHLRGYHRSREWILNSRYCTNRLYSVTETPGNLSGGNGNWLCAIDITVPTAKLLPMCQRLDVAVRGGGLEKITEWYGNVDGDTRVDGYNNIQNRVASSDTSHLWHLHISLDRGRADENHDDLYQILTGGDMLTDDDIRRIWDHSMQRFNGLSVAMGLALASIYVRSDWITNKIDLLGRLERIEQAANNDGDVTVTLPPEGLALLSELKQLIEELPDVAALELSQRLAE